MHRNSKVDVISANPLPGKGEVVQAQDRFQPPPYYSVVDDPKTPSSSKNSRPIYSGPMYVTPNPPKKSPTFSIVKSVQPSIDSFASPDDNKPSVKDSKPNDGPPPSDSFDSIISYTPPPASPSETKPKIVARPMPKPPARPSYDSPYSSYNPPMDKPPMEQKTPPSDSYDSPYNSYNPQRKPPKPDGPSYPPLSDSPYPPQGAYLPPSSYFPSKPSSMAAKKPPKMNPPKPMEYLPPPSPPMDMENESDSEDNNEANPMDNHHDHHHHPHKFNHDQVYDNLPEGVIHEAKDAPDDVVDDGGDDGGNGNGGNNDDAQGDDDKGKANDDDDMAPPPEHHYPHLPKYVEKDPHQYNFADYYHHPYHHVYHEVHHKPTTTTTEAPKEETRVSSSHYSYYYLGRKLWYIPLYFSVYFICYITALILKSIARHKVSLVHTYGAKEARSFDGASDNSGIETRRIIEDTENRYAM